MQVCNSVCGGDDTLNKVLPLGSSVGFLADLRRMNVALTRAKYSLLVVGHASSLQKNVNWRALIDSAKERNLCAWYPLYLLFGLLSDFIGQICA